MATVDKDGYVRLGEDIHYYSVPHTFIGKKMKMCYTASHVEIFDGYRLVATHPRSRLEFRHTTNPEHLSPKHKASCAKLMSTLKIAKVKGTILAELKRIERVDVLILDDFGMQPFDSHTRGILMDIIEDRHRKRSTVITSQLPVKGWYEVIGEKTVADAILDRLVHSALRIELYGESIRKRKNTTQENYK